MSLENEFEEIVRKVIREELAARSETEDLQLLTAEQVAGLLGFTDTHSVYRLRRNRELSAVVLGDQTLRFSRAEVKKFIRAHAA